THSSAAPLSWPMLQTPLVAASNIRSDILLRASELTLRCPYSFLLSENSTRCKTTAPPHRAFPCFPCVRPKYESFQKLPLYLNRRQNGFPPAIPHAASQAIPPNAILLQQLRQAGAAAK